MFTLRNMLLSFLLLCSGSVASLAASDPDQLVRLGTFLQNLHEQSANWHEQIQLVSDQMRKLDLKSGALAVADVDRQIKAMRLITGEGISDSDSFDLAYFKASKAKLSLSLARSAVTRAITAATNSPDPSRTLIEDLLALAHAMDQCLAIELPTTIVGEAA